MVSKRFLRYVCRIRLLTERTKSAAVKLGEAVPTLACKRNEYFSANFGYFCIFCACQKEKNNRERPDKVKARKLLLSPQVASAEAAEASACIYAFSCTFAPLLFCYPLYLGCISDTLMQRQLSNS